MSPTTANFRYPWPLLSVALEGQSIVDTPRLEVHSMEEATAFLTAYGFDPSDPGDIELLWRFFEDAVLFVSRTLADPEFPEVPEHLRSRKSVQDIRRLLILASEVEPSSDQRWACALLRLIHVLVHLQYDPRLRYFENAQNQILARLDAYLWTDPVTGTLYLGGRGPESSESERIKLLYFKKKDRKDREREIIKLLHKRDNLAEEIFDRVGFRMVTETKLDAMRAVRLLIEKNVISVPNIRPGRSRNRLFSLQRFRFEIDRILAHIEKSGEDAPYVEKMIRRLERRISPSTFGSRLMNQHSSEHYRSIQFTCRALVKTPSPMRTAYDRLRQQLEALHGGAAALQEVFPVAPAEYDYVFFPYEIQILDVKAYADSVFGKSSHDEYRRKQRETARDRVFGRISASGR